MSACLLALTACERESPPPARAVGSTTASHGQRGPLETLRLVHRTRRDGRTAALSEFLVPEQRDAVIEHLLSVDELTAAGESLKQRVGDKIGPASAVALDRTGVSNALGVFSRDVECLSETVRGDNAVVSIRVAGRLPLEQAELVRREGRWLVRTDSPIPGLAAEMRNLAKAVRQVAQDVERRQLSAEQVEQELNLRQGPALRRIEALVGQSEEAERGDAEIAVNGQD